jgi:hypothetical protein
MKKHSHYIALLPIAFLVVVSSIPKTVLADGLIIRPEFYSPNRWDYYSGEDNQQAFINYDNGLQKMIISVGLEEENSEGVVWIFPVPSDPNKVTVDVVKSLPQLIGKEVSTEAKYLLYDTEKDLQATQLYTIFFNPFLPLYSIRGTTQKDLVNDLYASKELGGDIREDVIVYEHLDKEGISSEIITAKTANGLYDYLKNKGLKIESGSIPVLDNYIGKEYSFVASWVRSPGQIISANQRGVFVTFPTKDIYFPLLPTSVYGDKTIPATIRVIGHVTPKVFQDIKSYTKTNYYVDRYASFTDDLKNFYSGQTENIKYTKIAINAPSKFLTDDLWINNKTPIKIYYSTFVTRHPTVNTIILLILSSILAGILAGLIVFKDLRKNPLKLSLVGLSNFLTILGLVITTVLISTKNKNESVEPLLAEIKQRGYFWKRKVATILFFVATIFLVFGLLQLITILRTDYSLINHDIAAIILPVLIIYVLPLAALVVSFIIKRIKPEDKDLFEQLKLAGYSSWSFQPKDKLKIAFVPFFSASFLLVSWLLVKLLTEFTL